MATERAGSTSTPLGLVGLQFGALVVFAVLMSISTPYWETVDRVINYALVPGLLVLGVLGVLSLRRSVGTSSASRYVLMLATGLTILSSVTVVYFGVILLVFGSFP